MTESVQELQRVVIKEELMALIETYYGRKNGIHMRAAFLNNLIFWEGIQLKEDKKYKNKIERAIQNNVNPKKIEKMKSSYRDGWFYKTSDDLMDELMGFCSPSSITRMNKEFQDNGWIQVGKNPDPKKKWDKSTWYKVDLIKINSDLNQLGYHLEKFKFNQEPQQNDEIEEIPSDSIFHGENSDEPASDSIFHGEKSNFHGESSNFHDESSNFHDGKAIPEGLQQKVLTEGETENLNLNPKDRLNDYIWSMRLPMPLKKYFSEQVKVLVNDSTFDISLIEYFYNTQPTYIDPHCTREDVWKLNDIEFTYVMKKMHKDVTRPINNMEGLIKSWVQWGVHYKIENHNDHIETESIHNKEPQEDDILFVG